MNGLLAIAAVSLVILWTCPFTYGGATSRPPILFADVSTSTVTTPIPTLSPSSSVNTTTRTPTSTTSASFPSLTGYSVCVINCLDQSIALSNCTSVVDVNCFCTSKHFTRDLVNCVAGGCAQEQSTADSLAQQFCNLASTSTSLSFPSPTAQPSTTTTSPKSTATLPTTSPSPPPTTTVSPNSADPVGLKAQSFHRSFGINEYTLTSVLSLLLVL